MLLCKFPGVLRSLELDVYRCPREIWDRPHVSNATAFELQATDSTKQRRGRVPAAFDEEVGGAGCRLSLRPSVKCRGLSSSSLFWRVPLLVAASSLLIGRVWVDNCAGQPPEFQAKDQSMEGGGC